MNKETHLGNYTVYVHAVPNGKKYVGITCQRPLQRWANGNGYVKNTYFYKAIIKYGWDNIEHVIIASNLSKDEACNLEKALIAGCKTNDSRYGYNISCGGESGTYGIKFGPEFGKAISDRTKGERNPNFGRKFSAETRKKLSDARKGKWSERQKVALTKVHESMRKEVVCLDTKTVYPSITEAARQTGGSASGIKNVCRGKQISSHDLHWTYYSHQSDDELDAILLELLEKKKLVYIVRNVWNKGKGGTYKYGKQKNPCKQRKRRRT